MLVHSLNNILDVYRFQVSSVTWCCEIMVQSRLKAYNICVVDMSRKKMSTFLMIFFLYHKIQEYMYVYV